MSQTNRTPAGDRIAERARGEVDTAMLDIAQVAAILNCSARHIQRLTDAGRMPSPTKLGSLARWNRREINSWIQEGCPVVVTTND